MSAARLALDGLLGDTRAFVCRVATAVQARGIQAGLYEMDHICYRCGTGEEYSSVCTALASPPLSAALLIESPIGGRLISTYQLREPLEVDCPGVGSFRVSCIEVPAPKAGRAYASGLEHAELVVGAAGDSAFGAEGLRAWRSKFPGVEFDERALGKELNADLSLTLGDGTLPPRTFTPSARGSYPRPRHPQTLNPKP
mmetsp:Transcript_23039/g.71779  ORF Transcript_23039/g.71779 Transcript_23039/m.71779 type:complete len:198 (+) Transcript_23039:864-1457(+)